MTDGLAHRLAAYLTAAEFEDVLRTLKMAAEEVQRRGKKHYTLADIETED